MGRARGGVTKPGTWRKTPDICRTTFEQGLGGRAKTTWHQNPLLTNHRVAQRILSTIPFPDPTPHNTTPEQRAQSPIQTSSRTYKQRKEGESAAWVEVLPLLKDTYMECMVPLDNKCCFCPKMKSQATQTQQNDEKEYLEEKDITEVHVEETKKEAQQGGEEQEGEQKEKEEKYIILCKDCGPTAYYCNICFHRSHTYSQLHVPLIWVGIMYLPYVWDKHLVLPCYDKSKCHEHSPTQCHMTMIDQYGRQHTVMVEYNTCMSKTAALLKLGFWPATPTNPVTAIDLRFMELCRCMLLEGGVAVYKFSAIMKMYSSYLSNAGDKVDTYRAMAMDCTSYHRRFAYDINYLQGIVPDLPDGSACPVCCETDGVLPKVVSMDGNFRLVRKKSAGTSCQKPHHEGRFFLQDEVVEPFLKPQSCAHDVDCSDFKAGTTSRANFKADKLDVTGVFGSICIHDYPQFFINMKSGEKLGYAVCIIDRLRQNDTDVKILYDVACRLQRQLTIAEVDLSKSDLAVGLFHGFAHNMKCQIEYNPRNKTEFRLADGENTERLWSDLSNLVYISKEMAPSNRHDLIVDALLHRGEKAILSVSRKMKLRLKNARELEEKSRIDLDKTLQPFKDQGIDVFPKAIEMWEVQMMNEYAKRKKKAANTWQMEYALLLKKWHSLRWRAAGVAIEVYELEAQAELDRITEKLQKIERAKGFNRWTQESTQFREYLKQASNAARDEIVGKMHHEAVDRAQLIVLKRRDRGHDATSRFSKQIQKTNTKLTTLLRHYNAIDDVIQKVYEEVKDPDAAIYAQLPSINVVPFTTLRDAVRLHNTRKRVKEEVYALDIEFLGIIHGYEKLNIKLQEAVMQISPPKNKLQEGVIAALLRNIIDNEKKMEVIALQYQLSFGIQLHIDSHYSDNMPCQYMTYATLSPDEEDEEEAEEEDNGDDHPSDDEVASDDEEL